MALLERIESMKQSGVSDMDIITNLSEEGISPSDINEAISQSRIKAAVSPSSDMDGMQQSIMAQGEDQAQVMQVPSAISRATSQRQPAALQIPSQEIPAPAYPIQNQTQAYYPPEAYPPQQAEAAYAYQDQAAYPQEEYAAPEASYYSQVLDVETVRDIAKQEIEDALKKLREQLNSLEKMKTDLSYELQSMENRLVRVESIIQEIQSSIIRKMGEYGEAISGISQEVRATQQSFSKMLGPLMDKRQAVSQPAMSQSQKPKKSAEQKTQSQSRQSDSSQTSASFEDYLR